MNTEYWIPDHEIGLKDATNFIIIIIIEYKKQETRNIILLKMEFPVGLLMQSNHPTIHLIRITWEKRKKNNKTEFRLINEETVWKIPSDNEYMNGMTFRIKQIEEEKNQDEDMEKNGRNEPIVYRKKTCSIRYR